MQKVILGTVLTLALVGTNVSSVLAKSYPDVAQSHWAYKEIQELSDDYVVVGYPDGTFMPDASATRAEFASMVVKALGQDKSPLTESVQFSDVPYSHWAYDMIQRAHRFDLIQASDDGKFRPEDNISKAEAISILIAAVDTGNMTPEQAKEILKNYNDANKIPDWALIPVAKSEKFKVTAHNPACPNTFEADRNITRAEISANLYNMKKEALLNPNKKLKEARTPKKAEGLAIDGVIVDGTIATIPAGTLIPAALLNPVNSQKDDKDDIFTAKIEKNLVTKKDSYLLISAGSTIAGEIAAVKPARYFIRNAKMTLETRNINTVGGQKADLNGNIDTKKKNGFFARIIRFVVKGQKIRFKEGQQVNVMLTTPVKIDLTNQQILK